MVCLWSEASPWGIHWVLLHNLFTPIIKHHWIWLVCTRTFCIPSDHTLCSPLIWQQTAWLDLAPVNLDTLLHYLQLFLAFSFRIHYFQLKRFLSILGSRFYWWFELLFIYFGCGNDWGRRWSNLTLGALPILLVRVGLFQSVLEFTCEQHCVSNLYFLISSKCLLHRHTFGWALFWDQETLPLWEWT